MSKKWQTPLFRESKFGQPEVARICKELILQAKSTTQQGAVFPQGKTAVAKRLGFSFEKPTVRRQSRLTRIKDGEAAAPPTPPEGFLTVCGPAPCLWEQGLFFARICTGCMAYVKRKEAPHAGTLLTDCNALVTDGILPDRHPAHAYCHRRSDPAAAHSREACPHCNHAQRDHIPAVSYPAQGRDWG